MSARPPAMGALRRVLRPSPLVLGLGLSNDAFLTTVGFVSPEGLGEREEELRAMALPMRDEGGGGGSRWELRRVDRGFDAGSMSIETRPRFLANDDDDAAALPSFVVEDPALAFDELGLGGLVAEVGDGAKADAKGRSGMVLKENYSAKKREQCGKNERVVSRAKDDRRDRRAHTILT